MLQMLTLFACTACTVVAYKRQVEKAEKKMHKFMTNAEKRIESAGFHMKAAFVTFNTQTERAICERTCPKRKGNSYCTNLMRCRCFWFAD